MTPERPPKRFPASGDLALILFSFDFEKCEAEKMTQRGIHIVILHRYARTDRCAPGEEIATAWIIYRSKPYQIPLSTTHLILLDYLCRHRGIAQTATQIAYGLSNEAFYIRHAANASGRVSRSRTSRTAVKEQIMRLRGALKKCFCAARIPINSATVLRSTKTSSNEMRYRLHAEVRWEH